MNALQALACAAVFAMAASGAAGAAGAAGTSRPYTLADLDWIEGTWRAQQVDASGVRAESEEHWGAAIGESRLGWFRSVRDGRVRFYEFEVMRQDSAGVCVNIKHFDRDVKGWEAPDSSSVFRLVRLGEREAHFEDSRDEQFPFMHWAVRGDSLHMTLTSAKAGRRPLKFGFARMPATAAAPQPSQPPQSRPEHPE
jgi:hypothetical protein